MPWQMVRLAEGAISTKPEKLTILANSPHLAGEVSFSGTIFSSYLGLLTFIQYNLVSEDDNIEFPIGL